MSLLPRRRVGKEVGAEPPPLGRLSLLACSSPWHDQPSVPPHRHRRGPFLPPQPPAAAARGHASPPLKQLGGARGASRHRPSHPSADLEGGRDREPPPTSPSPATTFRLRCRLAARLTERLAPPRRCHASRLKQIWEGAREERRPAHRLRASTVAAVASCRGRRRRKVRRRGPGERREKEDLEKI